MKIVHILPDQWSGDTFCAADVDFTMGGDQPIGWCQFSYMEGYGEKYEQIYGAPWEWCPDCLDTPDFALSLLAIVGCGL
jgi:hypothetical protein